MWHTIEAVLWPYINGVLSPSMTTLTYTCVYMHGGKGKITQNELIAITHTIGRTRADRKTRNNCNKIKKNANGANCQTHTHTHTRRRSRSRSIHLRQWVFNTLNSSPQREWIRDCRERANANFFLTRFQSRVFLVHAGTQHHSFIYIYMLSITKVNHKIV